MSIAPRSSPKSIAAFLLLALAALTAPACSGDDDEGEDHEHGDVHPECAAITAVCHDVEGLSDLALECHDLGHDNDMAACEERQDECVTHCESLGGHGGAGGAGGASH